MNLELKELIKDLYRVEKNPEAIFTILKDEGHELTIEQVNEVLGVRIAQPVKVTKLKGVFVPSEDVKESAIASMNEAKQATTDIDKAIEQAIDAIQEAHDKVNNVWNIKKNAGQEAGRYVRACSQLRTIKKSVEG